VVLSTQEGSKIKIHDSWYLYQENRPTPPSNLAHFKTNHDGLVLPPNFDNIFFIAFVVLSNQEGSKTARSKIMIFGTYVGFTDPHHHQTWLTWIPTKMDWFCQQTLPTSFFAFVVLSTQKGKKNKKKIKKKPRGRHFMIFGSHARQAYPHHHQTWLTSKPTKMDWFCHQTLSISFLLHFWCFPTKMTQKP